MPKTKKDAPSQVQDKAVKEQRIRERFAIIIAALALVISALSLVLGLFPQLNPVSVDFETKAKAGDLASQLFLADRALRRGEYNESLDWYEIAAMKEGEHQVKAYNNIGYIYAVTESSNGENAGTSGAIQYFLKAYELGSHEAAYNLFAYINANISDTGGLLLSSYSDSYITYNQLLENIRNDYIRWGEYSKSLFLQLEGYEPIDGLYTDTEVEELKREYLGTIVLIPQEKWIHSDNSGSGWYETQYTVFQKTDKPTHPNYKTMP